MLLHKNPSGFEVQLLIDGDLHLQLQLSHGASVWHAVIYNYRVVEGN